MLNMDIDTQKLASKTRSFFGQTILNRGWNYYKGGEVRELQVVGQTVIKARVSGTSMYRVTVDLNEIGSSTCTCPYDGFCKHLAAVIFKAYKEMGEDPIEILSPALKNISGTSGSVQAPAIKPNENGTTAEWQLYFGQKFGAVTLQSAYDVADFYARAERELSVIAEYWQPSARGLYRVHVQLFMMKQLDSIYIKLLQSYYYPDKTYFTQIVNQIKTNMIQAAQDFHQKEAESSKYLLHLSETMDYLADHAFPDSRASVMDWPFAYRFLWWNFLRDSQWIAKEQSRLQALINKSDKQNGKWDDWVMALVHFDVMADHDEAAMMRLEKDLKHFNADHMIGYMETFAQLEQWDRLIHWLKWLQPSMKNAGHRSMNSYFHYWAEVSEHREVDQEWKQAAIAMLPGSFRGYASRLFEKARYQEWVDLCLLMDISPLDIQTVDLKLVNADNLRWLLPLYHHAAERYIQEKNRDSYKRAVRLLKKLGQAYKKLKDEPRWLRYLEQLSRQYARYRALQEELRKGKLIE